MATWLFGTQLLHVSIIPPFLDFPIMFHWTRCSPMDWICQLPYSRTFALTSQTSKHRGARSGLFSFFFSPFFVQEGARMLHLTKTYLISIFSPLCYFLCILIKQGKKKTPSRSENRCFKCTEQCLPGNEHSRQLLCFKRSPGCRLIMKQFSAERILLAFQITV